MTNGIGNQQIHFNVTPCGKCKLCPQINTAKLITNKKLKITEKIKGTGNYKEREIIYAAQCSKHKNLYIGHVGEQLSECFSKHCYDIKNRSDNSELTKHFYESHNLNSDLNVTISQNKTISYKYILLYYKTISKLQPLEGIVRTNGLVN